MMRSKYFLKLLPARPKLRIDSSKKESDKYQYRANTSEMTFSNTVESASRYEEAMSFPTALSFVDWKSKEHPNPVAASTFRERVCVPGKAVKMIWRLEPRSDHLFGLVKKLDPYGLHDAFVERSCKYLAVSRPILHVRCGNTGPYTSNYSVDCQSPGMI
jgi:hypothetical protein